MKYFTKDKDFLAVKNDYLLKIITLSDWIWKNELTEEDIDKWINNFQGVALDDQEHEHISSLHLLKQYMYFGIREIRQLLRSLYYNKFYKPTLHNLIKNSSTNLESDFEDILNNTKFLGVGNPSESSGLLLYMFRQENNLPSELFCNLHDVFQYDGSSIVGTNQNNNENIKNYIFIDDISGTGTQAYGFFSGTDKKGTNRFVKVAEELDRFNPDAQIHYLTLFSTECSRKKMAELEQVKFESIFELDSSYKVYEKESRYFVANPEPDPDRAREIGYAKRICEEYFDSLETNPLYKFGFLKSQLLLSFFYNTPNNTIPLFWEESSKWYGLFKRYEKVIKE